MSSLRWRRADERDAAVLAAFAEHTFAEAFGAQNRPEDMAAHAAENYGVAHQLVELRDPDWVTLVAEEGATLAAYAQLRPQPAPACVRTEAAFEVVRFYVDRRWHGAGVAQRLMALVRETARERGARSLWLSVWERNPRAIAFYAKEGFRDVGTAPFVVGADVQTDRVMVADLAGSGPRS